MAAAYRDAAQKYSAVGDRVCAMPTVAGAIKGGVNQVNDGFRAKIGECAGVWSGAFGV
jgi:hypothetical protein